MTHIHNHIFHPLISSWITQIHQDTVAVPSPYRSVPIPYRIPLLQGLLIVVMTIGGSPLADVAKEGVDVGEDFDSQLIQFRGQLSPVLVVTLVNLGNTHYIIIM